MNHLKQKAKKLKKNRANTKWLIVEIMKRSSIDFDIDHACKKLYQYGFGQIREGDVYKWMRQLCDDRVLIFNGWKPEYVDEIKIGATPVFGLIRGKGNELPRLER